MSPFECLLALVSILVGLAVADLSISFHHLLRARHRIRWDWLSLVVLTGLFLSLAFIRSRRYHAVLVPLLLALLALQWSALRLA